MVEQASVAERLALEVRLRLEPEVRRSQLEPVVVAGRPAEEVPEQVEQLGHQIR